MPDIFVPNNNDITPAPTNANKPQRHIRHLASFCENPLGVSFENQDPDENILLFLRKHLVTNIPWIFVSLLLIILPFVFSIINSQITFIDLSQIPQKIIVVFLIFYYLIVFNYIFINFITWFYTISLVTNKRVVDIDFSDLVYHNVAATKLSLIQDVDYTQVGFIRTFFNYGDVFVQTAGEKPNFDFLAASQPTKVVYIIENLIGKRRGNP
ncbi:MAG: hypothetical protein Q8P80_02115 [Candidatus Levybacteria bacterium]|nr:hypothetical protein [Candidatus Levybacteria bacterium]